MSKVKSRISFKIHSDRRTDVPCFIVRCWKSELKLYQPAEWPWKLENEGSHFNISNLGDFSFCLFSFFFFHLGNLSFSFPSSTSSPPVFPIFFLLPQCGVLMFFLLSSCAAEDELKMPQSPSQDCSVSRAVRRRGLLHGCTTLLNTSTN